MPARLKEKFTEGGAANYSPDSDKMPEDYYRYRKWSKEGIPLPSKLKQLY